MWSVFLESDEFYEAKDVFNEDLTNKDEVKDLFHKHLSIKNEWEGQNRKWWDFGEVDLTIKEVFHEDLTINDVFHDDLTLKDVLHKNLTVKNE